MAQNIIKEDEVVTQPQPEAPRRVTRRVITEVPVSDTPDTRPKDLKTEKTIFRTYQVVWYILGIIEILLAFRLILKFLGASLGSGFTQLIYGLSDPFALPFRGILPVSSIGNSVMEWPTFIAMALYVVLAWVITEFFRLVKPVNEEEIKETLEST